jgi:DNA-binding MarR family transcriptional regulator
LFILIYSCFINIYIVFLCSFNILFYLCIRQKLDVYFNYTIMEKITKVYKEDRIMLKNTETHDTTTGVVIDLGSAYVYRLSDTKLVKYDCDHYVYLNTNRLSELIKYGMDLSEIGLLMAISIRLKPILNVCLQIDDKPHTTRSISELIGYSSDRTKKKLDKLIELGIIGYQRIKGHEDLRKVYHVNPHYVRIGYNYSEEIPVLFNDTIEEKKRAKNLIKVKKRFHRTPSFKAAPQNL